MILKDYRDTKKPPKFKAKDRVFVEEWVNMVGYFSEIEWINEEIKRNGLSILDSYYNENNNAYVYNCIVYWDYFKPNTLEYRRGKFLNIPEDKLHSHAMEESIKRAKKKELFMQHNGKLDADYISSKMVEYWDNIDLLFKACEKNNKAFSTTLQAFGEHKKTIKDNRLLYQKEIREVLWYVVIYLAVLSMFVFYLLIR